MCAGKNRLDISGEDMRIFRGRNDFQLYNWIQIVFPCMWMEALKTQFTSTSVAIKQKSEINPQNVQLNICSSFLAGHSFSSSLSVLLRVCACVRVWVVFGVELILGQKSTFEQIPTSFAFSFAVRKLAVFGIQTLQNWFPKWPPPNSWKVSSHENVPFLMNTAVQSFSNCLK